VEGRSVNSVSRLDELETFETNRYKPVSVPVLIEKRSYFVVATPTAPLRRKGRMTPAQIKKRAQFELIHGRRRSGSDAAVIRCLAALARPAIRPVVLESDRKPSYGAICRRLLCKQILHLTHDSRALRDRANPLFPNQPHQRHAQILFGATAAALLVREPIESLDPTRPRSLRRLVQLLPRHNHQDTRQPYPGARAGITKTQTCRMAQLAAGLAQRRQNPPPCAAHHA
jgi:hypothetical protein